MTGALDKTVTVWNALAKYINDQGGMIDLHPKTLAKELGCTVPDLKAAIEFGRVTSRLSSRKVRTRIVLTLLRSKANQKPPRDLSTLIGVGQTVPAHVPMDVTPDEMEALKTIHKQYGPPTSKPKGSHLKIVKGDDDE